MTNEEFMQALFDDLQAIQTNQAAFMANQENVITLLQAVLVLVCGVVLFRLFWRK